MATTEAQRRRYHKLRGAGLGRGQAALESGISYSTAQRIDATRKRDWSDRDKTKSAGNPEDAEHPKTFEELCPEAQRAFNDFPFFQEYYLGRIPLPWQEIAAQQVLAWVEDLDHDTYAVINAPPGVGKTLLFTHDIPCWLTIRNRAIRGLMGAITGHLASAYVNRLRRTLEATRPIPGKPAEVRAGTAYDAKGCIATDFGRFKPLDREIWTKESFVVAQVGDYGITEKEATWTAYGFDQEFIGSRIDFMVWDDLVNPRKQRTQVAQEQLQNEWDDLVETRLEPGGVLLLPGQRLSSADLYRYNLDKRVPETVDDVTGEILESIPRYQHLCFQAHAEDRCSPENHKRTSPAFPEGCLLAPRRIDWPKISYLRARPQSRFNTIYQQEDTDPATVLVQRAWVNGSGEYPGCLDNDRKALILPSNLQPPLFSAMSVDPSPTRYWGLFWAVYQPSTEQRFVMDLDRRIMKGPDFLELNPDLRGVDEHNGYSGLLEEWWCNSRDAGVPITHLIVEINVANRFLVQYKFFTDWLRFRGVQLVPHTTGRNKTDENYGVWSVQDVWRFGRIRLPNHYQDQVKFRVMKLVEEVCTYPDSVTTDMLMAHWFYEFQLPKLARGPHKPTVEARPSWMKNPGPPALAGYRA